MFTVRTNGDTISADLHTGALTIFMHKHQGRALYNRQKAGHGPGGSMPYQAAKTLAAGQIHDHQRIMPAGAGISNEGHTGLAPAQVKAHIVQITGGQSHIGRKANRFDDLIG